MALSMIQGINVFRKIIENISDGRNITDGVLSPDIISKGRLTRFMSSFVVRPNVIISKKLEYADMKDLKPVIDANLKIFAAYYVQAFQALINLYGLNYQTTLSIMNSANLNTTIGSYLKSQGLKMAVNVMKGNKILATESIDYLDLLNNDMLFPGNEAGKSSILKAKYTSLNKNRDAQSKLHDLNKLEQMFIQVYEIVITVNGVAVGTVNKTSKDTSDEISNSRKEGRTGTIDRSSRGNSLRSTEEHVTTGTRSQRTGSKIETSQTINNTNVTITIPVIIHPSIVFTDSDTLIKGMLSDSKREAHFLERLEEYRAGVISLSDLIFATDLIKKYKERSIKSRSDVVRYLKNKKNISDIKSVISGRMSFDANYNVYIFDTDDKFIFDDELEDNLYKPKVFKNVLEDFNAFSMSFVDMEKERMVLLMDTFDDFMVVPFRMLRKEKDLDVNDVFKNLLINKPPF